MTAHPDSASAITRYLEELLEVEFTFLHVGELATSLAALAPENREFLLGWTRRIASTNIQIAYQFALRAIDIARSHGPTPDRGMGTARHGYL